MATTRNAELVVTIPSSVDAEFANRCGVRMTLGALTELLASATSHVIMGAPFIQGEEGLHAEPIATALKSALARGVRIDVVSTSASLSALRLGGLRRAAGSRLRTFQPRTNAENSRSLGSHAKFCLADGEHAYLGSANFTQMGMGGHLELGVLIHGAVARQAWRFLVGLMESEYLIEVPILLPPDERE